MAKGSFARAVGFTILCTRRFPKIVGLIFNKALWSVELRLEFTKLISGVMLITPEIGKSGFYWSKAFINIAPRPWDITNVERSLSQQFLKRV